ncbi:MAG: DUF1360 domain-containing protein [Planctomycetaceae bacterium]|jgi:hypothetical protein|nr:DUF1360 domain-containing protein [Planctomycetaceae bacterium]
MIQMPEFLLFCFAVTGMTLILVQSTIFEPFRKMLADSVELIERNRVAENVPSKFTVVEFLHKMLQCLQCAGFWCGLFCGLLILTPDILHVNIVAGISNDALKDAKNYSFFICLITLFRWIMLLFCCGAAGSFLAPLGDLLLQWIFISKELVAKQLLPENHTTTNHQNNQTTQNTNEQNNIDQSADQFANYLELEK